METFLFYLFIYFYLFYFLLFFEKTHIFGQNNTAKTIENLYFLWRTHIPDKL